MNGKHGLSNRSIRHASRAPLSDYMAKTRQQQRRRLREKCPTCDSSPSERFGPISIDSSARTMERHPDKEELNRFSAESSDRNRLMVGVRSRNGSTSVQSHLMWLNAAAQDRYLVSWKKETQVLERLRKSFGALSQSIVSRGF